MMWNVIQQTQVVDQQSSYPDSFEGESLRQMMTRLEEKQDRVVKFIDESSIKKILQETLEPELNKIWEGIELVLETLRGMKAHDSQERQLLCLQQKKSINFGDVNNNAQWLAKQKEQDRNKWIIFNSAIQIQQKHNSSIKIDMQQCHNERGESNSPLKFEYSQFQPQDSQFFAIYDQYEGEQGSTIDFNQSQSQSPNLFQNPTLILQNLNHKFIQMDLKFKQIKLLYNYAEMKDINFHQKIDKINNLFFMAQLENNQVIAAFTHLPFDPQPNYIPKQNPKSFICNLTKNVFVYAYKINRTLTYDKNFLVFGNWQIKVRTGSDILQTNWGTNGDCFIRKHYNKDEKSTVRLQWLFGNGAIRKELCMKQYQIYCFD